MQALLAVGAALAYLPVMRGLFLQIRKKYNDQEATATKVSRGLMWAHQIRYATWIWVGVLMWREDPVTAMLLMVTRLIGFCLIDVTHLQRTDLRPNWTTLCGWIIPHLTLLSVVALILALFQLFELSSLLAALGVALKFGLGAIFLWLLIETGMEIKRVRLSDDARRLPDFQFGNLCNYPISALYALFGTESSWSLLMAGLFSIASVAQAALYFEIYQARKRYRQRRAQAVLEST